MYQKLYNALKQFKQGTSDESNGRHIIPDEIIKACSGIDTPRILDVGAGRGTDLCAARDLLTSRGLHPQCFAVESFHLSQEALRSRGIDVKDVDVERDSLPYDSNFFDVVLCNQVLEHTKEIFWVTSELARVTRVGGTLIVGVPNLASLHNRVALLLGQQPPSIHILGPHVRGFTPQEFKRFFETGGQLKVQSVLGGNFYPFPPTLSRPLSRLLPGLSVSSFYIIKRTGSSGSFLDVFSSPLASALVDTPYFRGRSI